MDERELREIRKLARQERTTVAEWVRRALRAARQRQPAVDAPRKLAVVRAAARHGYPTADIDQMLNEIEAGYRSGTP